MAFVGIETPMFSQTPRAFISYSHRNDSAIARLLQRAMQRLGKPWYLPWAIHVFRDETDLTASAAAWGSITRALDRADHFVLLASKASADSDWVRKEICYWLTNGRHDRFDVEWRTSIDPVRARKLLIALVDDQLGWCHNTVDQINDFDWSMTTALPKELAGVFEHEPLWVDLRPEQRPATLSLDNFDLMRTCAKLAAPIHYKDVEELDKHAKQLMDEDYQQHRRTLRYVWRAVGVLGVLLMLAVTGGVLTWIAKREAFRQKVAAESYSLYAAVDNMKAAKTVIGITTAICEKADSPEKQITDENKQQLQAAVTYFDEFLQNANKLSKYADQSQGFLQDYHKSIPMVYADVYYNRALALRHLEKPDEAQIAFAEGITAIEKLAIDFPDVPPLQLTLLNHLMAAAELEMELQHPDHSFSFLDRAIGIAERTLSHFSTPKEHVQQIRATHPVLYDEENAILERLHTDLLRMDPFFREQIDLTLADVCSKLLNCAQAIGDTDKLISEYRRVVPILAKIVERHPKPEIHARLGEHAFGLARLLLSRSEDCIPEAILALSEAENSCAKILAGTDTVLTREDMIDQFRMIINLKGSSLRLTGRNDEAVAMARSAVSVCPDSPIVICSAARELRRCAAYVEPDRRWISFKGRKLIRDLYQESFDLVLTKAAPLLTRDLCAKEPKAQSILWDPIFDVSNSFAAAPDFDRIEMGYCEQRSTSVSHDELLSKLRIDHELLADQVFQSWAAIDPFLPDDLNISDELLEERETIWHSFFDEKNGGTYWTLYALGAGETEFPARDKRLHIALKSHDPLERLGAAFSVARLGTKAKSVESDLIAMFKSHLPTRDQEFDERKMATFALAQLNVTSPNAVEALCDFKNSDFVQAYAAARLGAIAIPEILKSLSRNYSETDKPWANMASTWRESAILALSLMPKEVMPQLINAASVGGPAVRGPLIVALARMAPDSDAVKTAVEAALNDPDPYFAAWAVRQLTSVSDGAVSRLAELGEIEVLSHLKSPESLIVTHLLKRATDETRLEWQRIDVLMATGSFPESRHKIAAVISQWLDGKAIGIQGRIAAAQLAYKLGPAAADCEELLTSLRNEARSGNPDSAFCAAIANASIKRDTEAILLACEVGKQWQASDDWGVSTFDSQLADDLWDDKNAWLRAFLAEILSRPGIGDWAFDIFSQSYATTTKNLLTMLDSEDVVVRRCASKILSGKTLDFSFSSTNKDQETDYLKFMTCVSKEEDPLVRIRLLREMYCIPGHEEIALVSASKFLHSPADDVRQAAFGLFSLQWLNPFLYVWAFANESDESALRRLVATVGNPPNEDFGDVAKIFEAIAAKRSTEMNTQTTSTWAGLTNDVKRAIRNVKTLIHNPDETVRKAARRAITLLLMSVKNPAIEEEFADER